MSVERRLKKKGWTFRVKRLSGALTATFTNEAVAYLQDEAWGRWGAKFPLLADRQPTLPVTLRAKLISKETPELTDELLADVLSYHPPAGVVYGASSTASAYTVGEYIVDVFFDKWKSGKLPGGSNKPKPDDTWLEMQRALNKIIFELEFEYDDEGNKLRDGAGGFVASWGPGAFAHLTLDAVTAKDVFAVDQRVRDLGIGLEVWRKARGFLRQMFAYARLDDASGFPIDRMNPVDDVPPPKQSDKNARRAYLPTIVEGIRADFYYLAVLSKAGVRRVRGGPTIWTPGAAPAATGTAEAHDADSGLPKPTPVPIPPGPEFGLESADWVEVAAYAGLRPPSELFGARGNVLNPETPEHLRIHERYIRGKLTPGTKSSSYKEKLALMIGPVGETIKRRVGEAGAMGLLFTWPGTDRPPSANEYKNWRGRYFGPIARGRGLDVDADDPYSLRHVYATVRLAAGHPATYINASMGSSLSATTYNTIQHELEAMGKAGCYDIAAEIGAARLAALAELEQRLAEAGLQLPAEYRLRFLGGVDQAEAQEAA